MSKTIKNCFDKNLTFIKLLEAHERAKKGKCDKKEILKFELDLETNIMNIYLKLKEEKYSVGKYREFTIYEPKERLIKALPYKDRIVHQWYVEEFIKPFIVKRFIGDSYACIENKGTHKAIKKLQGYMRIMKKEYGKYYVLKCDVKKFFYTINKDILFNIMKSYISDKKLLNLTKIFIYDNDDPIGIPIGNYTSQYFANIYLNELDHYIKDKLKIKYYVRFMDDFVLLLKDKYEAKLILNKINIFVASLKLELNNKTRYYPSNLGIDFCGYVIYENYIKVRKRCIKKIKRKVKKWNELYKKNKLNYKKYLLSFNSFKGHIKHSNSYNLCNKIYNSILFVNNEDINIDVYKC